MAWQWLVGPVLSVAKYWFKGRELKAKKKLRIEEIKALGEVHRAKALAEAEANYDNLAQLQMQSSWKDEYLVLALTSPFIISFAAPIVDGMFGTQITSYIDQSWIMVAKAPDWYQWSLLGIIISVFGLRWYAKTIGKKMLPGGK